MLKYARTAVRWRCLGYRDRMEKDPDIQAKLAEYAIEPAVEIEPRRQSQARIKLHTQRDRHGKPGLVSFLPDDGTIVVIVQDAAYNAKVTFSVSEEDFKRVAKELRKAK